MIFKEHVRNRFIHNTHSPFFLTPFIPPFFRRLAIPRPSHCLCLPFFFSPFPSSFSLPHFSLALSFRLSSQFLLALPFHSPACQSSSLSLSLLLYCFHHPIPACLLLCRFTNLLSPSQFSLSACLPSSHHSPLFTNPLLPPHSCSPACPPSCLPACRRERSVSNGKKVGPHLGTRPLAGRDVWRGVEDLCAGGLWEGKGNGREKSKRKMNKGKGNGKEKRGREG